MGEFRALDMNEVLCPRPPSADESTETFIAAWNVLLALDPLITELRCLGIVVLAIVIILIPWKST